MSVDEKEYAEWQAKISKKLNELSHKCEYNTGLVYAKIKKTSAFKLSWVFEIDIKDRAVVSINIKFCPFCGEQLPPRIFYDKELLNPSCSKCKELNNPCQGTVNENVTNCFRAKDVV